MKWYSTRHYHRQVRIWAVLYQLECACLSMGMTAWCALHHSKRLSLFAFHLMPTIVVLNAHRNESKSYRLQSLMSISSHSIPFSAYCQERNIKGNCEVISWWHQSQEKKEQNNIILKNMGFGPFLRAAKHEKITLNCSVCSYLYSHWFFCNALAS